MEVCDFRPVPCRYGCDAVVCANAEDEHAAEGGRDALRRGKGPEGVAHVEKPKKAAGLLGGCG